MENNAIGKDVPASGIRIKRKKIIVNG